MRKVYTEKDRNGHVTQWVKSNVEPNTGIIVYRARVKEGMYSSYTWSSEYEYDWEQEFKTTNVITAFYVATAIDRKLVAIAADDITLSDHQPLDQSPFGKTIIVTSKYYRTREYPASDCRHNIWKRTDILPTEGLIIGKRYIRDMKVRTNKPNVVLDTHPAWLVATHLYKRPIYVPMDDNLTTP